MTLTIIGEHQAGKHQAGKSYTLCLLAIDAAFEGKSVFYACAGRALATERFRDVLARCEYQRACCAAGNQYITLHNGAKIRFGIPADRGHAAKVVILDDVPNHPEFYMLGAELVIRSELVADADG